MRLVTGRGRMFLKNNLAKHNYCTVLVLQYMAAHIVAAALYHDYLFHMQKEPLYVGILTHKKNIYL